jgi:hypothetical protein
MKDFKRVLYANIEELCSEGAITKGALVKYRWAVDTLTTYDLDTEDNEWRFGVVTDIMWYVTKPTIHVSDKDGMLHHDIGVRDTADNKYLILDVGHFEIFIPE